MNFWYSKNIIAFLLLPLSWIFSIIVLVRRFLYQNKILKSAKFNVPVIVVGNITVGGSGKTPMVIWLAEFLQKHGYNPGIISRGYKATTNNFPVLVTGQSNSKEVGDEPVVIASRTCCPVIIDPKRPRGVKKLIEQHGCNIIISDDGLQHYALARDIEINMLDSKTGFGNDFCLPAGPLREPISRLESVDFIIANSKHQAFPSMTLHIVGVINLNNSAERLELKHFAGQAVNAVAGIGHPENFFSVLNNNGLEIIANAFADHHEFQKSDFNFKDDLPILMTEKDAVKCREFNLENAWYLKVSSSLDDGLCKQLLQKIKEL